MIPVHSKAARGSYLHLRMKSHNSAVSMHYTVNMIVDTLI